MKRKFKLFSSLASLIVAISVMAVGVYATKTASFGVGTNITFTPYGHIKCAIVISDTGATGIPNEPVSDDYTSAKNLTLTRTAIGTGAATDTWTGGSGTGNSWDEETFTLSEATLNDDNIYYSYKITITNQQSFPLSITATQPTQTGTGYTVTWVGTGVTATTLAVAGTHTITCTVLITTRDGSAITIVNSDMSLTVALEGVPA